MIGFYAWAWSLSLDSAGMREEMSNWLGWRGEKLDKERKMNRGLISPVERKRSGDSRLELEQAAVVLELTAHFTWKHQKVDNQAWGK